MAASDCDFIIFNLTRDFRPYVRDAMAMVYYDEAGRCNGQYWLETTGENIHQTKYLCLAIRVMGIVKETVQVMTPLLKLSTDSVTAKFLQKNNHSAGCTGSRKGLIFIQPFQFLNPMDVVSVTIHELAHLKVMDLGHHSCEHHCIAWKFCVQLLTQIFAVSTIYLFT